MKFSEFLEKKILSISIPVLNFFDSNLKSYVHFTKIWVVPLKSKRIIVLNKNTIFSQHIPSLKTKNYENCKKIKKGIVKSYTNIDFFVERKIIPLRFFIMLYRN
jgi:hypothetical protein